MSAPFFKWVGGKTQLLSVLLRHVPPQFGVYHERFVGGGALFFALQAAGRLQEGAVLSDVNPDLICAYRAVRDDVEAVIRALSAHVYESGHYYETRALDPETLPDADRAARFLYIMRCGFNGLWRVNRAGRCNVPFGRYTNPTICDAVRLRGAALALRGVRILLDDFRAVEHDAEPGDFVYFDPPYWPKTETANFTAYAAGGFGPDDQAALAAVFGRLADRGVYVLASNHDVAPVRALYAGHRVDVVPATRRLNCDAGKRGAVGEVIVSGGPEWDHHDAIRVAQQASLFDALEVS